MCVDFIKVRVNNVDVEKLLLRSDLDFRRTTNLRTGEYNNYELSKYHFCKIKIFDIRSNNSQAIIFSGSIHKMINSLRGIAAPNAQKQKRYRGFNGNNFDYTDCVEAFKHLCWIFNCKLSNFVIQNIEFGLNLKVDFDPNQFIKGLILHKGKEFEFRYNRYYAQVEHQRFYLKCYNKSDQYGLDDFILRWEIKTRKAAELERLNLKTLADFKPETLFEARKMLVERLDETLYFDNSLDRSRLSVELVEDLKNLSNPRYWLDELPSNRRDQPKKKLNEIIAQYSSNLKLKIRNLILAENVRINNSNIVVNHTQPNRRCAVTGLDISMQKDCSLLLSHTGIYHYLQNEPVIFDKLCRKFLTDVWKDCELRVQVKELAHNIRNDASNRRIRQKKLYPVEQMTLFDIKNPKNSGTGKWF